MKVLVQRVSEASVTVDGSSVAGIGPGLLLLLGVTHKDTEEEADYLVSRCADLRIFNDEAGKMNLSVRDTGGSVLVVSQFTLYGDTRKGNRPSFVDAARPELAERLYERFVTKLKEALLPDKVRTGVFRADMTVGLVNDGPVTLLLQSK
jgi:D-tyrosyl-tRNA(Tyr) deacylase